jgi:hypothetical protein
MPPNGLPFSCRKRAQDDLKSSDLAREAVGWNGGFGGASQSALGCGLFSAKLVSSCFMSHSAGLCLGSNTSGNMRGKPSNVAH